MIRRCFRGADRWAAVCCVVLLAGCQGGFGCNGTGPQDYSFDGDKPALRIPGLPGKPAPKAASADKFHAELAKGQNLQRAGKLDEARKIYEPLIADYPQHYQAFHGLAVVADQQRRHREAEALYAQAIRLNGREAQLFNDLGYCLLLQGELAKAESALLKAVTLRPADSRCRNNLGLVLGHLGRYDDALEQFRHGGSEADAFYNLAFVWAARNENDEAKRCFHLALEADPAHELARRALTEFERYEADPHGVDDWPVEEDGTRWVAYVEGTEDESSDRVEPATHNAAAPARSKSSTRPDTQSLLKRARSMLSDRMATQQE